jgi:hypothetical protein
MQRITFYDNRGRMETADMKEITFSDGITRAICTHAHVPPSYLPKDVYQLKLNDTYNEYTKVGTYTTTETKSTYWLNTRTAQWDVTPGETIYHFAN